MSKKGDIRNEGLADKLAGFNPEPPEAVWDGISSQIQPKQSRKGLFVWFLAAAGLLLAISVGVKFLFPIVEGELAVEHNIDQSQERLILPAEDLSEEIILSARNGQPEERINSNEKILGKENILTSNDDVVAPIVAMQRSTVVAEENQSYSAKEKPTRIEKKVLEVLKEVRLAESIEVAELDLAGLAENAQSTENTENAENTIKSDSLSLEDMSEKELIAALVSPVVLVEDEAKKKGKWQFGAALSPQYSYRDVASSDLMQNAIVNSAESGKITYAGGLNVSYLPNDKLTIESGVFYNKMGVNIGDYSVFGFLDNWKESWNQNDYVDVNANVDGDRGEQFVNVSNSMGTVMASENSLIVANYGASEVVNDVSMLNSGDLFVEGESVDYLSQSFEYLEIPFNLKYKIYDKGFIIQIIGGLSTNFLIGNKLDAITSNGQLNIGSVANVKTVNYSGNAGFGILYDLFDNFTLSVEPRFRYYLNSVNTDYLPATRPYALGFYTGLSYSF